MTYDFIAFFNLHRNLHKGMKIQRSNENRKLLYHLDNKFVETDGELNSVELSNYSMLTASAIFVKTKATPETTFVSDKLIGKDETGFLKITNIAQSLLVPKCFAIGNCASKSTQKMRNSLIETILNDFGGNL